MKLVIWAKIPSPHQRDFYTALRHAGVDLVAVYSEELSARRRAMGWKADEKLPEGEFFCSADSSPFNSIDDWQDRIHVIPGYSRRIHRRLARELSTHNVPWVHWSESSQPSWRSYGTWPVKRWYGRMVNRHALGAFAQGATAEADFERWGIRKDKIAHLFYAINEVPPNIGKDETTAEFVKERTTLIFVGGLIPRKRCEIALRAYALATRDISNTAFVVVGDGVLKSRLQRLTHRLGIADRVLFRGAVPMEQIGSVMNCAQVHVLPSRFDGWGVVLNEAASTGLALIASDRVGAAYHLIEPGYNGIRVKAGSVASMGAAIRSYLSQPDLAREHGARSRQLFQEFTPEKNAKRLCASIRVWLGANDRWDNFKPHWNISETKLPLADAA